jgi:hypothetical protein
MKGTNIFFKLLRCWLNNSANGVGRKIHSNGDLYLSNFIILAMLEIVRMIWLMATESLRMPTGRFIKVSGQKTKKMVRELGFGLMEQNISEILKIIITMEKERLYGLMEQSMLVTGKIIIWMVKEHKNGQMATNI